MLEIREEVEVFCLFRGSSIKPIHFIWHGRKIQVDKINLVHTSKDGGKLFYHFSVSSGGNFYRLGFNLLDTKWVLEAVEEDA